MNQLLLGFVGPFQIIIILLVIGVPIALIIWLIVYLAKKKD